LPSFVGGGLTLLVYGAILSLFSLAFPLAFERQWHTDRLSGCFVVGIPLEELIYGFACGVAATALYPYLWAKRFVGLGAEPGA